MVFHTLYHHFSYVLSGHEQSGSPEVIYQQPTTRIRKLNLTKEGQAMTKHERENWIINIENSAAAIESQLGSAVVNSVFKRYGAHDAWDVNPCDLPAVFSELYAIEADLD